MPQPSEIAPDSRIGALEPLLDLAQQRERRQRAGMAAGAGANQNEAVDAMFGGLARMLDVDHVMEHHAAIGMRGLDDFDRRPQRGDDDRHLVLHAGFHVLHQPVVGGVADLVDRVGRDLLLRMQRLVLAELVLDAGQPFVELFDGAGVQRRERADDAGLALGDHEFGSGHDEQRRADHRQFERIGKRSGQRHSVPPVSRKAGYGQGASIDVDLSASGRAEPLAVRLLRSIIGLDGTPRLFNIEQVTSQK